MRAYPTGDDHAFVLRQDGIAGQHVGWGRPVGEHLAAQVQPAEATGDGERLMAVGGDRLSRMLLAIGGGQRSIKRLPGGLQQAAEDGLARGEDGGLQLVEGGGGLEGRQVGQGHLDGGQFGQQVSGQVVRAADEDTEGAHGELLGLSGSLRRVGPGRWQSTSQGPSSSAHPGGFSRLPVVLDAGALDLA